MEDLAVSGDYAHVVSEGAGLQVIDLTVPAAPRLVGEVDTPGAGYSVAVSGNCAFVADGSSGLQALNFQQCR